MPSHSDQSIKIPSLLELACNAALDAGSAILEVYQARNIETSIKPDNSPITLADKAAHSIILKYLEKTGLPILSEEGMHADFNSRKDWDWYWLVDPLDGTKEFLKRNGEFTVNIALMQRHMPMVGIVYAPVADSLYYGSTETGALKKQNGELTELKALEKKVTVASLNEKPEVIVIASRSHLTPETVAFTERFKHTKFETMGSSLKFMLLAENKADIYPRFAPTMEWDTAAAHAILRVLGRGIYQTDLKTELVYNKPDLHNPSFIAF